MGANGACLGLGFDLGFGFCLGLASPSLQNKFKALHLKLYFSYVYYKAFLINPSYST